jgi:hypothetical protein
MRNKLWNGLEELKVHFKLRVVAVRLYENTIAKFRNTKGSSEEINCNIGIKQGCPLSPTIFGIYIDKLEYCLKDAGCVIPTLTSIVIIILLYSHDIFLVVKSPSDLSKK